MQVKIKENSFIAKIAALKFRNKAMGITLGSTIHLHRTTKADFLKHPRWVRHELEHVLQFRRYGFLSFIFMYLLESLQKGYYNNKWEVAARNAESDNDLISRVQFRTS